MTIHFNWSGHLLNILSTPNIEEWLGLLDLDFLPEDNLPKAALSVRSQFLVSDSADGNGEPLRRLAEELGLPQSDRNLLVRYAETQLARAGRTGVGVSAVFCASNLLWALAWSEDQVLRSLEGASALRQGLRPVFPRDFWRQQIETFEDSLAEGDLSLLEAGRMPFDYLIHRRGVERAWVQYCIIASDETRSRIEARAEQYPSELGLTLRHHDGHFPKLEEHIYMLMDPSR